MASVNSHGAGRGFDGDDAPRGVLCLLGSMMAHSCAPSAFVETKLVDTKFVVALAGPPAPTDEEWKQTEGANIQMNKCRKSIHPR